MHPARYHPFIPANAGRGAGVVFFADLGFDAVSTTAAEARAPQRAVPIGMLGSLDICTVLYVAFALVLTGMLNDRQVLGGFASVMLVGLLPQSRVLFAMARDGMVPAMVARLHRTITSVGTLLAFAIVRGGVLVLGPLCWRRGHAAGRARRDDALRPLRPSYDGCTTILILANAGTTSSSVNEFPMASLPVSFVDIR